MIEVKLHIETPIGTPVSGVMSKTGPTGFTMQAYRPLPEKIPADSVAAVHWRWANWGTPEEPTVKEVQFQLPPPKTITTPGGNVGFSMDPQGLVQVTVVMHAKAVPDAFVHWLMRNGATCKVWVKNESGGWTPLVNDNLQAPHSAAIVGEKLYASPPATHWSKATGSPWPKPTAMPKTAYTPHKIQPQPALAKSTDPRKWAEAQKDMDWDA